MSPLADDLEGRCSARRDSRPDRVRVLIDALHSIVPSPSGAEEWMSERDACAVLGTTVDELQALVEAGLAERHGTVERFDVWNVGLRDGAQGARPAREMVFLDRMMRSGQADWLGAQRYDLTVTARCPRGAGCDGESWTRPTVVGAHWVSESAAGPSVTWRGRVVLKGMTGGARSAEVDACWDQVTRDYRFQYTSPVVAGDVDLTRGRRVGDCVALSLLFADELRRSGTEAWVSSGYMFGGLRMRQHQWVTARGRDGGLVTLDPSMALLADDFFGPEFREFCRGSRSNRCLQVEGPQDWLVGHRCAGNSTSIEADLMLRAS